MTNQVTSASYTGSGQPANEAYSYTKNGNRTNTGYSTGTNNQLLSDGTFNYSYDGEGNRTVRTRISNAPANDYRTTYSWDYRNRLTDVEYFNNSGVLTKHVHYVYDSLDHEIGKQVDDTGGGSYDRAEWYVLDVAPAVPQANVPSGSLADPLLQFDQNGNLQFRYFSGPTPAGDDTVYAEEQIGTQGQAGTETWPLGDNENTPHEVVNVSSTEVDHIIANTFGVVTSESNTSIHHWSGFEGGHLDVDTAMIDNYFRWYDPATAKWLSEDPKGFTAGDADLSRYVGNTPTVSNDPVGLQYPPPAPLPPPSHGPGPSAPTAPSGAISGAEVQPVAYVIPRGGRRYGAPRGPRRIGSFQRSEDVPVGASSVQANGRPIGPIRPQIGVQQPPAGGTDVVGSLSYDRPPQTGPRDRAPPPPILRGGILYRLRRFGRW